MENGNGSDQTLQSLQPGSIATPQQRRELPVPFFWRTGGAVESNLDLRS
jgi:hypothetical protein